MNKAVRWIEHQGKKILLNDYTGLKGEQYLAAIEATRQEKLKLPVGTYHRALTIISGTAVSAETTAKGQEVAI